MKIRTLAELEALRRQWKASGRKVVWTNGCFDLLHAGHIRSLHDAKALGDILIVGINSDAGVRTLKGPSRPVNTQQDRAEILSALEAVDYVVVFDEPDPCAALSRLQPDIHCKGAEYADGLRPVPERDLVLAYGGEVRFLPTHEGRSTSNLIARLSGTTLQTFLAQAASVRVLVIGDCMLDTYINGAASRISPEAPVPVVAVSQCRYIPGGAANVAANAHAMGAQVTLAGVVGNDESARRLITQLREAGVATDALVEDASRRTTTKTRITAAGNQIVRFDEEDRGALSPDTAEALRKRCEQALVDTDVCIVSDYAKGVVTPELCRWLMSHDIPIVVDPKARDLSLYRGATVITPNLKETALAAREPIESFEDLKTAASHLLRAIAPSSLLVTRGEEGMSLFQADGATHHLPAMVNEVADVTGAGDTVVSALAVALGCGLSLAEAADIANTAAAVAVSHAGTWAVRASELIKSA